MSSMSFIAQSQVQRSQRVQSPTNAILQAGSDCSCNHSNLSMIAQSQKVGCGCNEGTNPYDKSNEDSNPPVPVFQTADGCFLVFSHNERVIVPDNPLEDKPDYWRPVYRRECPKDGGTSDGGSVGGGGKGGGGNPFTTPPNDPFGLIGTKEPSPPPKICLTCKTLQSLYAKYLQEMETGIKGDYTGEERIAYQALFQFMSDAMKNVFDRSLLGDGSNKIGPDNYWGESDDYYGNEYQNLRIALNLTGNITPTENYLMKGYFQNMLEKLAECPRQMTIKLGRTFNNTGFIFENHFEMTTPNGYLDVYGPEKHRFVSETTNDSMPDASVRTSYASVFSIGQNARPDCGFGYTIYKWVNHDDPELEDAWVRQTGGVLV